MASPLRHGIARTTLALLAAAGAIAGCSSAPSRVTVRPTPAKAEKPGEITYSNASASLPPEVVFEPFATELAAERRAGVVPTVAYSNNAPVRANTPGLSVYGEVGGRAGLTTGDYDGAENLTQVSFAPEGADFDPCIARDGKWVVYASTQHRPTPDIYVKSTSGRTVTQLTQDPASDVQPSFSPDGKRIAFASDRRGSWDIFVMSVTGGQPMQLTDDNAQELHPSWSPDGRMIAFCRLGATSGRWELWVVDVGNPAVQRFLGYGLFPEWAPVGNKILFQRSRERGDRMFSAWTIDFDNGEGVNPTEVASSPIAAVVNPAWSPDGRKIAFATIPAPLHELGQRPDVADLWIQNIDGSGRANLTGGRYVNLMPTWGADNRIYFISDRGGHDNVWSLTPDRAIVAAGGAPAGPSFANVPTESAHEPEPSMHDTMPAHSPDPHR